MTLHIPSPPVSGLHVGPLGIHVYGLMYVIGISLAAVAGAWRVRRASADTRQFMDAVAPALLVARRSGASARPSISWACA